MRRRESGDADSVFFLSPLLALAPHSHPPHHTTPHYTHTHQTDQIKSPVPFFAISQALSTLFRQILSEPTPKLLLWRRRISHALAKEGHVLADVLPTLENVFEPGWIDTLPPVPLLGAEESVRRFRDCVLRVLKVFAREGRPLVLVFGAGFFSFWEARSDLV